MAMMRVATSLLSPGEMGKVSLVLTTVAFFALFFINPVGMFINRRLHDWYLSGLAITYIKKYIWYLLYISILAAAGLIVLSSFGILNFGIPLSWLIILVCGSLVFNTMNQTSIPGLNMLGFSNEFLLLSLATVAGSFACAVLLVYEVELNAEYWLLGVLLGQVLLSLVGTRTLFNKFKNKNKSPILKKINYKKVKSLFYFAWPIALYAGLGWIQGQGYRYLMGDSLGLAQLGLFVAGYGISTGVIGAFESILTTYFQPKFYRDISASTSQGQAEAWHRYANIVIPSLLITTTLVIAVSEELTALLLGSGFQDASNFVVWGALAEAARVLVGVYSLIAQLSMQTRLLVLPGIIGAILSIGLCVILIPQFGAIGVGVGLVVSGFSVLASLHYFLINRVGGKLTRRPILLSIASSILLFMAAFILRHIFSENNLIAAIIKLMLMGTTYLAIQYCFLRRHLGQGVHV